MFFKERAMLVAYSMYLIGVSGCDFGGAIIHLIDKKKSENYLLIELPEYKIPQFQNSSNLCMGEGKRLSYESRNYYFYSIYPDVDNLEFRTTWIYNGYVG